MTPSAPLRAVPAPPAERPSPALPAGAREAALLLHSLVAADREWLIGRLSEGEKAVVQPLLAELADLGIRADRALVEEVLGSGRERAAGPARSPATPAQLRSLSRADPERIAALLRGEPAWLVAEVLRLGRWPWRDAVLKRLGRPTRRRVEALAGSDARAPGCELGLRILETLIRRLEEPGKDAARRTWSPIRAFASRRARP